MNQNSKCISLLKGCKTIPGYTGTSNTAVLPIWTSLKTKNSNCFFITFLLSVGHFREWDGSSCSNVSVCWRMKETYSRAVPLLIQGGHYYPFLFLLLDELLWRLCDCSEYALWISILAWSWSLLLGTVNVRNILHISPCQPYCLIGSYFIVVQLYLYMFWFWIIHHIAIFLFNELHHKRK